MNDHRAALAVGIVLGVTAAGGAQDKQNAQVAPDPELKSLAEDNTHFALDLYAQLRKEDGNLFFSPASISTALAMTYGGARGNTAAEMAQVLHFELEPERLHSAFARLLNDLDVSDQEKPAYRLYLANALWPQEAYGFLPEFIELCRKHYDAEVRPLDFAHATEQARQTINGWVEQRTAGKIEELIKPGILDALTRLVLTNAIYFKGDWAAKFDEKDTQDGPFTLLDGRKVSVPLMHQTREFNYLDAGDIQVLELPYAGDALSMVVLLPPKNDGLPTLEESLDAEKLAGWLGKLRPRELRVTLPRFQLTSAFKLNDVLIAMGMRDAFDVDEADFSGMDGTQMLYISAVVHKAFVDVNEEGTEAAAATAVVMRLKATPQPPPEFRADHPFLFLIRDTRSGSVLFLGRVLNPTK